MKPVPPTLRDKKRYIAFKIISDDKVSKNQVVDSILSEICRLFGELHSSDFGIWVIDFDEDKKVGIIVCNHRFKDEIIAALTLICSLNGQRVSFYVLGVSGTIKALKRKFLKDDTNKGRDERSE